jgi:hypothetical protein
MRVADGFHLLVRRAYGNLLVSEKEGCRVECLSYYSFRSSSLALRYPLPLPGTVATPCCGIASPSLRLRPRGDNVC